ncbi:MAG TPA: NAD(P)H nitroreductase [Pseudonocardia sp.]
MTVGFGGPPRSRAITNRHLETALKLAVRAPSLHNSQPWLWRVDDSTVQLYLDDSKRLPATDPQCRELVISCGAALHHLLVALASMGRHGRVHRLPDPASPSLLARVDLSGGAGRLADAELAEAIERRRTDRRRFTSWPVPVELIGKFRQVAAVEGLQLHSITDPDQRWRVYQAIEAAAQTQYADPAHTAELAAWSGKGADSLSGVPAANVPPPEPVVGQPHLRRFERPELLQPPSHGEPEAAALLVVSTPADTVLQWLRAGEVTSAILLTATRERLASSPLSQPLEVPDTREFLRERVTANAHPQILLRVGFASPDAQLLPATPRRPLNEVIASVDGWHEI